MFFLLRYFDVSDVTGVTAHLVTSPVLTSHVVKMKGSHGNMKATNVT